jgi:hypothetical protein
VALHLLASASRTPTVGLFLDNKEMYQPYGNDSIAINTNTDSLMITLPY